MLTFAGRKNTPMIYHSPKIMGIINATENSFYSGSRAKDEAALLDKAEQMLLQGAEILDIGACSTRPGSVCVPEETELKRAIESVRAIAKEFPQAVISIDTFRAEVAKRCVDVGAMMINDISGGDFDDKMFEVVAESNVSYVLTHTRGMPDVMSQNTDYKDLINDIKEHLSHRIARLNDLGHRDIIIDPGFGFAKTREQNFEMLNGLLSFKELDLPILVGISRKGMIWKSLGITPEESLNGTTVLNTIALLNGASILRVHDVKEAAQTVKLVKLSKLS